MPFFVKPAISIAESSNDDGSFLRPSLAIQPLAWSVISKDSDMNTYVIADHYTCVTRHVITNH